MNIAATAINSLGLDLLARGATRSENALLSPYSIQMALAMAYAGADGDTRAEMARVLHYPEGEPALHRAFAELCDFFKRRPGVVTLANRLFGQVGFDFRPEYLALLRESYQAPLEVLDFASQSLGATLQINQWVETQTHRRIRDVIPAGALHALTRLVLVNAIHLNADWNSKFKASLTAPRPFHRVGGERVDVPTMQQTCEYRYARHEGFTVLCLPYASRDILHLVILLPDAVDGLGALEAGLTAEVLAGCANLDPRDVTLYLPKFRLEPPAMALSQQLQALGLRGAFDRPTGSANFERMAPRRGEDYLMISEVFHKAFLNLDENGTEAAAATALPMPGLAMAIEPPPPPIEVRVDRPFLFAIQERGSGACLFLGRVMDPR